MATHGVFGGGVEGEEGHGASECLLISDKDMSGHGCVLRFTARPDLPR